MKFKKKKMNQAKYNKITQPSLPCIQAYRNCHIQKPQLWSNSKDHHIKTSFSCSTEIIPLL